jgi:3-hydroxymyristoyl/3-hydroxydecanoyl-(acyl carrier protein) dehydratase
MRYQFYKICQIEKVKKNYYDKKNVTTCKDFFEEHFVGFPVMPGRASNRSQCPSMWH